jgi:hypothetical protein
MDARKAIVLLVALGLCAALVSACGSGGRADALRRCPREEPAGPDSISSGTKGEAVPRGAVAAIVCHWHRSRVGESTVRGWPADRLARTMDALPPSFEPEPGAAYACEAESEEDGYLVGFAYSDGTGEQMELGTLGCGWGAVNLRTGKAYEVTGGLTDELDRDLRGEP